MVRQTAGVMLFEVLGGLLFLGVIALTVLAWNLSRGPVELSAFEDNIEQALTEARGGRAVTVQQVELHWSPDRRRMDVTARGVVFYTSTGEVGGRADAADLELDTPALLFGEVNLVGVTLRGGVIDVRQLSPDTWSVSGEPLPPIPAAALPETPAEWLASLNRVLGAMLSGGADMVEGVTLRNIGFSDMRVDIHVMSGQRIAGFVDVDGSLKEQDGDVALVLTAQAVDAGLPEQVALTMRSSGGFDALQLDLSLSGWSLSQLADRMGIKSERLTGLPAEFTLGFQATREGGLTSVTARGQADAGAVQIAGVPIPVTRIDGEVNYDTGSDTLDFAFATLDVGVVRGEIRGSLGEAVFSDGERPLSVTAPSLRIDATPAFERPWQLAGLEVNARLLPDFHTLRFDRLRFQTGGLRATAQGQLARHPAPSPGELPFSLQMTAELTGEAGNRTVLDFWPTGLARGPRNFLAKNVEAGTLTSARAEIDIRPDSRVDGRFKDEAILVEFAARDADVRFLSDMPAVEKAWGTGRLTGNSFSIHVTRGRWASWTLDGGSVSVPSMHPRGGDMIIEARGRGPVRDAVGIVFRSKLDLEAQTGFNPDRLSGQGDMYLRLVRPALDDVPPEDIRFSVTGQVREAGISEVTAGMDLENVVARVDLNEQRIAISGFGALGPAEVNFEWRDEFDDDNRPSRLTAMSTVTPDVLNRFGLLGRPYVSGEVPVKLTAQLQGEAVVDSRVEMDLTGARIDLAEIGWLKPSGDTASATLGFSEVNGARRASAELSSETARLNGNVLFDETGRLLEADLDRAFLTGRADVSGTVTRTADGGLSLSLRGPVLDMSGLLPGTDGLSGSGGGLPGAFTIDAEVERLILGDALSLGQARLAAIASPQGLQSMTATGNIRAGAALELTFQRRDGSDAFFRLNSDDAGAMIETFFGSGALVGGRLSMEGILRGADATTEMDIRISGARLRDSPLLTQILSLGSLRGLADTLGGEGVLFSEIVIPLRTREGRFVIDGGRASGPAMGFTVNGWIEPDSGGISLDGVLVPSFGVNSALGGVPIIGDLFVGREGEGVFSLTYSVRGQLERAQVAVNPLSAITPGVLRRIFENPTSTELPLPEDTGGQ